MNVSEMTLKSPVTRGDIQTIVMTKIYEILPNLPTSLYDEDKHLQDLGADSIDRIEIITSLLHQLDIRVDLSVFSDIPNIASLNDILLTLLKEKI